MSNGGSYDPKSIEAEIYRFWEDGGHFNADPDPNRKPFTIVIPPPNVTGVLHLGHALNNTLQDILIRTKRMQGFVACWLPGTDHAGIATQAQVEKRLREDEGQTRHELGRDGLVARIWAWKEDYNNRIINQLRTMGCSCDWRRTRFTLDDTCARAVYTYFFRMFRDGLIFRGKRLVNWDTQLQTAVADDELYHETVKNNLWHIRYPVEGREARKPDAKPGEDYLVIATTRPETMLADVAVAVHPEDERYAPLVGKNLTLPLVNRPIPVIADGVLVNREFGTGCVKVTPAHDPNDYVCGQRHNLPMPSMLNPDGTISALGGEAYAGLPRAEARKRIVADLEALGLMEKIEPYETQIGHSDRSKSPIEPLLSEQWFVRMDALAESAMEAVRDGRVQIFPERFARSYLDWLAEKRDWCISRQLWWGHRIPIWTKLTAPAELGLEPDDTRETTLDVPNSAWTQRGCAHRALVPPTSLGGDAREMICTPALDRAELDALHADLAGAGYTQDADVLDTWFSSALWPLSTFGWPAENAIDSPTPDGTSDLGYFYPTDVLSTARDIISLWVARMVIAGLYNVGRVPFSHVCIHPTIQDGNGKRMSKSAGNGVDPLDLIAMYGADAMRFTLASMAGETQDMRIPVKPTTLDDGRVVNTSDRFELGRNFCNKLWQAASGFILPNIAGSPVRKLAARDLAIEDHWILSRLSGCIAEVEQRQARFQFSDMTSAVYQFFWSELCDWYIELVKPRLASRNAAGEFVPNSDASAQTARQVLAWVLDQTLRLLHPIAPFITEALWKQLNAACPQRGITDPQPQGDALIVAQWPDAGAWQREAEVEQDMRNLQDVIRALRDVRAHVNVIRAASKEGSIRTLPLAVIKADKRAADRLQSRAAMIQRLGQVDALEIGPEIAKPPESASKILTGIEVYVPLTGLADLDVERKRLRKERDELCAHIQRTEAKLANEGFVRKAPAQVVERERERIAEMRQKLATIDENLSEIGG